MTTIFIILTTLFATLSMLLFFQFKAQKDSSVRLSEELKTAQLREQRLEEEAKASLIESAELRAQVAAEQRRTQEEQLREEQRTRDEERREREMSERFKNLATEIFRDHTQHFKQSNKESLDQLLTPFKENIAAFRERVETIYNFENEQRGALRGELEQLMKLNQKITSETQNLTNALRGNSKVQGDWGEMILETILESSNLQKNVHYTTQQSFKAEEGNTLRPDVVVKLPGGKRIIVDSKCSLTAYARYAAEESAEERKRALEAHILSVRKHIKELSDKEYQRMVGSPDFVVMFVPSEPAFLAALQSDSSLWGEAYRSRVIISSPTNLFALLKLVDDQWKRDLQDKNTQKIMEQGSKLYEKLVLFAESLEGVGEALTRAQGKYDEAYNRFAGGRGNLVTLGRDFKRLGVTSKREFSEKTLLSQEVSELSDSTAQSERTL